jgi:hypothetical protein
VGNLDNGSRLSQIPIETKTKTKTKTLKISFGCHARKQQKS